MKRQKRAKKIKLPKFIGDAKETILKRMAALAVLAVIILLGLVLFKAFLEKSHYFILRTVEVRGSFIEQSVAQATSSELLGLYNGRNVFDLNLKSISRSIQASYPEAKDVIVRIGLPDKLIVSLKFSRPIAIVERAKRYPIDEEGFVFSSADPRLLKNLPVITGVDVRRGDMRGKKAISRNLALAIELLKAVNKSKFLSRYGNVRHINAQDSENMIFYLAGGTEVRMGSEKFEDRLDLLERTLKDPRLLIDQVKYIDLRFTDVIIGPK